MSQKFLNKPGFAHFWERLRVLFGGLDTRVTALEQSGGEANIIDSISFNGTNVPPDASKNVALVEADPTVPAWAKQNTKPSYTAQEVGALPDPYFMQYASLYYQDNGLPEGMSSEHKEIVVQDKDGRNVGYIRVEAFKNGDTKISVYASNFRNMGNYSRGIEITQKKDGSVSYRVDEPDQFRLAIQAQENVGFYIDAQGYICQRISSDT